MKYALGAMLTVALITPALSQQFYIVQNPSTKQCTVVEEKPTDTSVTVMGNRVFTSRSEAQSAIRTVCTETTGSGGTTVIQR
jgi:hypothetical protein